MRDVIKKNSKAIGAALCASVILISGVAQARDDWRDYRDYRHERHWQHDHRYYHNHDYRGPRVVERPVYVAPAPVYAVPQMPMYNQPADPSLNFNFTVPLR